MSKIMKIMAIKNGSEAYAMAAVFSSVMALATKSVCPNGGVVKPIAKLQTKITPKCTGSTPTLTMTGSSMVPKIIVAEADSISAPAIRRKILTKTKSTYLLLEMVSIHFAIISGICSIAKI